MKGIGGHQKTEGATDVWLTPQWILKPLGSFDLDPCSAVDQPWRTARTQWTVEDDGLSKNWKGRVWLNPPYGQQTKHWLEKMAKHRNGIALVFARTETKMFFDHVWYDADALLFLKGRIRFCHAGGSEGKYTSGGPSVLIAYGYQNAEILCESNLFGDSRINGRFLNL